MSRAELLVAVLAAGASRRLGRAKQQVLVGGEPLLRRQCRCALAADVGEVIVVVGCDATRHRALVADLPVEVVDNEEWTEGLASTLRVAARAAHRRRAALLVLPCDQYRIIPDDLRELHGRWRADPSTPWMTTWDGFAGPPAILPVEYYKRVRQLHGDVGARSLLCGPDAPRAGTVVNPRAAFDLDSPADLRLAEGYSPRWAFNA